MAIELKIPEVGESVTEAMIGEWLLNEGDHVDQDDPIVVIETDKASMEIPAPESGTLTKILKEEGDSAEVGEVIGHLEPGEGSASGDEGEDAAEEKAEDKAGAEDKAEDKAEAEDKNEDDEPGIMPAARRLIEDEGVDVSEIEGTGRGGRILKEDVKRHVDAKGTKKKPEKDGKKKPAKAEEEPEVAKGGASEGGRRTERVRMTPLRKTVARRLVEAQQDAALLTTFNEIDMSRVIDLRKQYQDAFTKRHGIKLGFMSFFVKASIEALKEVPGVNGGLQGDEIVYHDYYDVGIAVGGGKGLVVPVIRNAERLSFAEVEKTIADFAGRAKDGKLALDELQGGTFTISNGGIYGSLLSTPIVNPPQSGILGLHKIEERPVAVDGEVVIRPMMYVALTYDHRLVDGREAVTFLVKVKERIEDPARILLEA